MPLTHNPQADFHTLFEWLHNGEISQARFEASAAELGISQDEIDGAVQGLRELDEVM
jgi:hypothetical protein